MKELCLGTAMWGWSVNKDTALSILDCFYEGGGRHVDTAYNYPLNGNSNDYRKSPLFLSEWCKSRRINDLKITFKVGSTTNTNNPENNLSPNYLNNQINWAKDYFSQNLHCVMLHWDNRKDLAQIQDTLEFLEILCDYDIDLGLSGIKYPELYKQSLEGIKKHGLNIQTKHNFLYSGFDNYKNLTCYSPKFWAYGISVSGLKLSAEEYDDNSYVPLVRGREYHEHMLSDRLQIALSKIVDSNLAIKNMYHIAIAYSELDKRLHGYIVAPSKLEQMQDILYFINNVAIEKIDLTSLHEELIYDKSS